jgi:hypothetical protein
MLELSSPRWKKLRQAYGSLPDDRVMLAALLVFPRNAALGNMLLDFAGDWQCANCETVFPPLGYDMLKSE